MNIYKHKNDNLGNKNYQRHRKNKFLSLDDMVGRYRAFEPINSVELKHKLK